MRGEKSIHSFSTSTETGSPPLARGKEVVDHGAERTCGITPACAGKSRRTLQFYSSRRDHPRLRGEKRLTGNTVVEDTGSPPLARGKAACQGQRRNAGRITPACAGKSYRQLGHCPAAGDHPRLRGEKHPGRWLQSPLGGSPPLARGKGNAPGQERQRPGITPACAGKRAHEPLKSGAL